MARAPAKKPRKNAKIAATGIDGADIQSELPVAQAAPAEAPVSRVETPEAIQPDAGLVEEKTPEKGQLAPPPPSSASPQPTPKAEVKKEDVKKDGKPERPPR